MSGITIYSIFKAINRLFYQVFYLFLFAGIITLYLSCKKSNSEKHIAMEWEEVMVSASAYNSVPYQTSKTGNPLITAWGDTLKPGLKAIAVSRDLMRKGLTYNTPVRIDGLEGIYFVKDKMHHKWKNKIDIYMGANVDSAKIWGRKKVLIHYLIEKDTTK